jgi:hypothetical protein
MRVLGEPSACCAQSYVGHAFYGQGDDVTYLAPWLASRTPPHLHGYTSTYFILCHCPQMPRCYASLKAVAHGDATISRSVGALFYLSLAYKHRMGHTAPQCSACTGPFCETRACAPLLCPSKWFRRDVWMDGGPTQLIYCGQVLRDNAVMQTVFGLGFEPTVVAGVEQPDATFTLHLVVNTSRQSTPAASPARPSPLRAAADAGAASASASVAAAATAAPPPPAAAPPATPPPPQDTTSTPSPFHFPGAGAGDAAGTPLAQMVYASAYQVAKKPFPVETASGLSCKVEAAGYALTNRAWRVWESRRR